MSFNKPFDSAKNIFILSSSSFLPARRGEERGLTTGGCAGLGTELLSVYADNHE
jgi:hypothetical protein